jgi:hypothetical protein
MSKLLKKGTPQYMAFLRHPDSSSGKSIFSLQDRLKHYGICTLFGRDIFIVMNLQNDENKYVACFD